MEEQAQKYCAREARRVSDRGLPAKDRQKYIRACVAEVMDNVISKMRDPELLAYHEDHVNRA